MASLAWTGVNWWLLVLGAIVLGPVVSEFPLVQGINIYGWSNSGCQGTSVSCQNIGQETCCKFPSTKLSVQMYYLLTSCVKGNAYASLACSGQRVSGVGNPNPSIICLQGSFRSGMWMYLRDCYDKYDECKPNCYYNKVEDDAQYSTSSLNGTTNATCKHSMLPNAVAYKKPGTHGLWVLTTGNRTAEDVLGDLEAVSDDQKESWLRSAGANFTA